MDRDPAVSIPIDNIQTEIESSSICLAEITTDNPNVWFELGYAIASQKEVVLVCSEKERKSRFPFDVQHRSIIRYSTESKSDFDKLKSQVTTKLRALLEKKERLGQLGHVQSVAKLEGLEQYEIAALVSVAQQIDSPDDGVPVGLVRQDMENAGFTKLATTLGLKSLLDKGMLINELDHDYHGDEYTVYKVTEKGMAWLFSNQAKLALRRQTPAPPREDDLPF